MMRTLKDWWECYCKALAVIFITMAILEMTFGYRIGIFKRSVENYMYIFSAETVIYATALSTIEIAIKYTSQYLKNKNIKRITTV